MIGRRAAALVAAAVVLAIGGCDSTGLEGTQLGFDELQEKIAEAGNSGEEFAFMLEDLTPEAKREFIESVGSARARADFEDVMISYGPEELLSERGTVRRTCFG